MRVLVAGATGAIGRPLLERLTAGGHEVIGMTRSAASADRLSERSGVTGVVCDAFDAAAVDTVFAMHRPDAVIDMLTRLPARLDPRKLKRAYAENDRVRREGSGNVIAAAERHEVGRYVIESVAFVYDPTEDAAKLETDPVWSDAPAPLGASVEVLAENERKVTNSQRFDGVVLRFGFLYGPGTYYASDGSVSADVRARRYPLIGAGTGKVPLIHAYDAARASVAALEGDVTGIFNIAHDESPTMSELISFIARLDGAKPPRRLPVWLARAVVGAGIVRAALDARGVDVGKATGELGFRPTAESWQEGFERYRDSNP